MFIKRMNAFTGTTIEILPMTHLDGTAIRDGQVGSYHENAATIIFSEFVTIQYVIFLNTNNFYPFYIQYMYLNGNQGIDLCLDFFL